ncbi:DUF6143 family protein [Alloiococcus sp. CFN-8]|uniref:DUF6143 family protein n=1 Tax=Alloiococcus sp. CFN-8 TaxID=3416081 RepID=UPI003CEB3405
MDSYNKNTVFIPNPISQVVSMPYALYLSLQGNYFLGSTKELLFGRGRNAWAGLFNPRESGVNLHVYYWEVSNTRDSPIRAQIWFNSYPPGNPTRSDSVTPTDTAISPIPKTSIRLLQASKAIGEPEDGVKAFVRRAPGKSTVGDVEVGKFIMPPGGSFVIFLGTPEAPDEPGAARVSFQWFEAKACNKG